MSAERILFVCLGNICRSPAAEGVMRHLVRKEGLEGRLKIASAGTIGMHSGKLPDHRMREAAARRGILLESRAQRITADFFKNYDLILTMDNSNLAHVRELAPDALMREKVRPLCSFCRRHQHTEVPDPYYGGPEGFELVLDLLEDACSGLLEQLRSADGAN